MDHCLSEGSESEALFTLHVLNRQRRAPRHLFVVDNAILEIPPTRAPWAPFTIWDFSKINIWFAQQFHFEVCDIWFCNIQSDAHVCGCEGRSKRDSDCPFRALERADVLEAEKEINMLYKL
jgi:hypothetical protein